MDKVCRKCRREGQKLFLKGEKCASVKCPFNRRSYAPGMHGQMSGARLSEYGRQLREKQKAAAIYGMREGIFRNYYKKASKTAGSTDEALLQFLELRLSNVLFRSGLASSRAEARQMAAHGHIKINGRRANIPSYQVKPGDKIELSAKLKLSKRITERLKILQKFITPKWLTIDKKNLVIEIKRVPQATEIEVPFKTALIVEYYSR